MTTVHPVAPRLSILICSLGVRRNSLERLERILARQPQENIEILVEKDDGETCVGKKRNLLLDRAHGDYVVYVDDDDLVADDYVSSIIAATENNPDAVAIEGRLIDGGGGIRRFLHSMTFGSWYERDEVYYRTPNHLNPIRRQIALEARFPEITYGEDHAYSQKVTPLILNEDDRLLGRPSYFYLASPWSKALPPTVKLLFKYPTRARPDLFRQTMEKYVALVSGKQQVRFLISIDDDDPTMRTAEMRSFLHKLYVTHDVQLISGPCSSKVEAVNRDLKRQEFDVLVVISDDMVPVMPAFDEQIANDMVRYFPRMDGALLYEDGIQKPGIDQLPIITLPVLGRKLYDSWGYVYHPTYISEWCDNEMTDVALSSGKLHRPGKLIIEHHWVGTYHRDDLHLRNNAYYSADKLNYERRKALGFSL